MNPTATLARYIYETQFEDLPNEVVEEAKYYVLDSVGCAIGGYAASKAQAFLDIAKQLGGGHPESILLCDGTRVSIPAAAFGNSALVVALDYCDFVTAEKGFGASQVGNAALPAALAVGEKVHATGKEFLTAVLLGYEVVSRLVNAIQQTPMEFEKVWGESTGTFAAAVPAGKLWKLSEKELTSTLGMAGVYAPVPSCWKYYGNETRPMRDVKQAWAWMSLGGVLAAQCARNRLEMLQASNILDGGRGFWLMVGAETYEPGLLTEALGENYVTLKAHGYKRYPGCFYTHAAVDGVRKIMEDNGLKAEEVDLVEAEGNFDFAKALDGFIPTLVDAQFSSPYQLAAAVLEPDPGPAWYSDLSLQGQKMREMMKRIRLVHSPDMDRVFQEKNWTVQVNVTITTKNVKRYAIREHEVKPLTRDELMEKFTRQAGFFLPKDRVEKIKDAILNLEKLPDVSTLTEALIVRNR